MPSPPHLDRLTPGVVIAAGLVSTTTGASLTAILFAATVEATPQSGGLVTVIPTLLLALIFAWPLWLTGLTVIGGPLWWLLHRSDTRTSRAGALAGAGLTFAASGGYLVLSSFPPPSRLSDAIGAWVFVAVLTGIGGAAGWVLVKVAYSHGSAQ